jgi:hypothetical protein
MLLDQPRLGRLVSDGSDGSDVSLVLGSMLHRTEPAVLFVQAISYAHKS